MFEFGDDSTPTVVSDTPVRKWKNLACKLFVGGESISEISKMVNQDEAIVRDFVYSPHGKTVIKQLEQESISVFDNILSGSKLDSLMTLLTLRDKGSTDTVRLNATKLLLDLSEGKDPNRHKSPEEMKKEVEQLLKGMQQS